MATAQEIEAVRQKAPTSDARVKVLTDMGQEKWRKIDDIASGDTVVSKPNGSHYFMGKTPGRPKKIARPAANDLVSQSIQDKRASLNKDPLYQTLHHDPDAGDVLSKILIGMAEEAASLRFEREEAERNGKSTADISARRVRALKAVGDNWLKRQEILGDKAIDLDGPAFGAILSYLAETLRNTMSSMDMRVEAIDTLMNKFANTVDSSEWRSELEARLRR